MKHPLEMIAELRRENEDLKQRLANAPKYGDWEAEKHLEWRSRAQDLEVKVRELEAKASFTESLERLRDDLASQLKEAKTEVAELKTQLAQAQAALKRELRFSHHPSGWLSPDEAESLRKQLAQAQAELQEILAVLRRIWDEDEMGYIVDANGVKSCGQCNSTITPEGGMTHEAYCLQGRIQPIIDRHKTPV